MSQLINDLQRARKELAGKWCQGDFVVTDEQTGKVCQVCACGSLGVSLGEEDSYFVARMTEEASPKKYRRFHRMAAALFKAIPKWAQQQAKDNVDTPAQALSNYNEDSTCTKRTMLGVFDRTIKRLKEGKR